MTKQEVKEIYDKLLELTKNQAIKWKRLSEDATYIFSFSRAGVSIMSEQGTAILDIFNDEGRLVASASSGTAFRPSAVAQFDIDVTELFNLVQEQTYKYSETSANILHELQRLEQSSQNLQTR